MAQALSQRLATSETHVLKMLSQRAPITEVLNELCNFIDAKSPGVIPTVLVPDGDGVHLRLAAGPKVPKIWNDAFGGLKVPSYAAFRGTAGHRGRTLPLADMRSDPSFATCWNLIFSQGVKSAWSGPILSKDGELLGTLIFLYATPHSPDDRDLDLLEQVIHMAAIAIECHRHEEELRKFSRRLYESQDEERRHMARELHDCTGQKLAVLAMNLSIAKLAIAMPPPGFDEILLQCTELTKSISDELRTLSYLLHPPMLDEFGLNTAIQWYVSGINQRNALHVEVEIPQGLQRLSEEAELAIFRIVQASLTNVHLHSGARVAEIRIEKSLDGIVVTITDQGRGIPNGVLDRSSRTRTVGIGITGMRERVEQLGGSLEIETGGGGTTIKATIPSRHFRTVLEDDSEPATVSML